MSNTMTRTGFLINARAWSLTDETTGEEKQGTTFRIATPIESGDKQSGFNGFNVEKLSSQDINLYKAVQDNFYMKMVNVACTLKSTANGFKATPISIELAK